MSERLEEMAGNLLWFSESICSEIASASSDLSMCRLRVLKAEMSKETTRAQRCTYWKTDKMLSISIDSSASESLGESSLIRLLNSLSLIAFSSFN